MTRSRNLVVWAVLVAATLLSWLLGASHGEAADSARIGTAIALLLAFAKAWIVGQEFMELRHAPLVLRAAFGGWVLVVGATLTTMYLLG